MTLEEIRYQMNLYEVDNRSYCVVAQNRMTNATHSVAVDGYEFEAVLINDVVGPGHYVFVAHFRVDGKGLAVRLLDEKLVVSSE